MRMKIRCLRFRLMLVSLLLCMLAVGCSSSNGNQTGSDSEDSGSESNNSNNNSTDGNSENNDSEEGSTASASSSGYEQLTTADFDYLMATDDQPDYNAYEGQRTYTENGYYYFENLDEIGSEFLLMFHDDASDLDVAVCSKANCSHKDEECDAYFNSETYPYSTLYYYDGSLYIFCIDEDYDAVERISADGTVREISCRLYRSVSETEEEDDGSIMVSTYYPEIAIHRGYAFYSTYYPGCQECGLYCVKLDSDEEATEICTIEAENPWIYRLKGYGAYLFFQMGTYQEEDDSYDMSIYTYNVETGEVNLCVEDAIRDYTAGGDCVYYFDRSDNVFCYHVATGETSQVIDSGGVEADLDVYIFVKDGKFYYADSGKQDVYDAEGNLVETLTEGDFVIPYVSEESE